ncbi:transcriptional regulator [Salmonella enterica]|uniref:Transcriptional regulator n=1 Tax=Salmonella enterica TaxID=28901 RepID=A0A3J0N3P2_SALER|nr:transcriptional regulator [Salmonella enterica]ECU4767639.1 transcriptional regulator [Salmonella enterica subsp. enterica]EDQ1016651.1 transcriptional regulator [Salmonella enterica subsp. houtenae serovar 50:z4,z23:-]EDV3252241.1 transcriptional regulator [Salmonella enterica subsp. houtenae]EDW0440276.1 transcriptional regulator [Salmonella enterica subsp. arizonae serovar 50:z4,z23:-]HAE7875206.1 transcriptional regulator [Salmonella enterica subsp. enterica serovar 1,9,12:-:-]
MSTQHHKLPVDIFRCGFVPGMLVPGQVSTRHFRLLTIICQVRSPALLKALEQVLVYGKSRRLACEDTGVTQSYFSVKYRRLQIISQLIMQVACICQEENNECK